MCRIAGSFKIKEKSKEETTMEGEAIPQFSKIPEILKFFFSSIVTIIFFFLLNYYV